jgi:phosphoribosyl 1,2-cyclic phosphodiesterase
LRLATRKQNSENITGAYSNSRSGIRGVTQRGNRWRAQARHNGKLITAGTFDDIKDAEEAVIALRAELFTHSDMDRAA